MQWMLAIQGQNFSAGEQAIALRCGADTIDVQAALNAGKIVRNWAQRGTWHFVHAPDVTWLTSLRAAQREKEANAHYARYGIDKTIDEVRQVIYQAIRENGPLTRPECYELIHAADCVNENCPPPGTMRRMGQDGHLIQLARVDGQEKFTLAELLPQPQRDLTGEELLTELGVRFASSRGPVTVEDLAWWTGAGKTVAKNALAAGEATCQLISSENSQGIKVYMATWQQDVTDKELRKALSLRLELPAFDEYIMAYAFGNRAMIEEVAPRVLTKNGISWDFIVEEGQVIGRAGEV